MDHAGRNSRYAPQHRAHQRPRTAGRQAWPVSQGGFRTTIVKLPAAAAGKNVKLRWRFGSDNATTSAGWRVDTVSISEVLFPCTYNILAAAATITAESFAPKNG